MRTLVVLLVALLALVHMASARKRTSLEMTNSRPIIGIVTLPMSDSPPHSTINYPSNISTIIPASYVKWLEQSGARVAVVPYDAPRDQLVALWKGINGLLFTGGGLSLAENTTYYQNAKFLYNLTLESNAAGDHFPIWGTCQGFQLLCVMTANDHSILPCTYDSENLPLALNFTADAPTSRLFGPSVIAEDRDGTVWDTLSTTTSTINLHHCGVSPSDFEKSVGLSSNFRLLSTNQDRNGKVFSSAMEHKLYPIYGVQWHPERPQFEWDLVEELNKAPRTFKAMQYMSDAFVRESRFNTHAFSTTDEEAAALIYNYAPIYTGNDPQQSFPDQLTYIFY